MATARFYWANGDIEERVVDTEHGWPETWTVPVFRAPPFVMRPGPLESSTVIFERREIVREGRKLIEYVEQVLTNAADRIS